MYIYIYNAVFDTYYIYLLKIFKVVIASQTIGFSSNILLLMKRLQFFSHGAKLRP